MGVEGIQYPSTQKEKFLQSLQDSSLSNEDRSTRLNEEIRYISQRATTPDFLEILHGSELLSLMKTLGDNLSSQVYGEPLRIMNSFQITRWQRFRKFISDLQNMAEDSLRYDQIDSFIK